MEHPGTRMSVISDGMSQNHCSLPQMANQKDLPCTLDQHLQGVLVHGNSFHVYRTFHNIPNNGNLNIYCLLSQLENWKAVHGKYPDVLYWQVDGGSENANQTCLGICELLIARGVVSKIVFTRLPVGHTHEDIDAKFAKLWEAFRTSSVHTPQAISFI